MNLSALKKEHVVSTIKAYFSKINQPITDAKLHKKRNLKDKKFISFFWKNSFFKMTRVYYMPQFFVRTIRLYKLRYVNLSSYNLNRC